MPRQEPSQQQLQDHSTREAGKVKSQDTARDQRMQAAHKTLGMTGPRPGGLAEVMADPTYLQKTREAAQQQRAERVDAMTKAGVKTPLRPAQTMPNVAQFADGASGAAIPVVSGNPRFRKE